MLRLLSFLDSMRQDQSLEDIDVSPAQYCSRNGCYLEPHKSWQYSVNHSSISRWHRTSGYILVLALGHGLIIILLASSVGREHYWGYHSIFAQQVVVNTALFDTGNQPNRNWYTSSLCSEGNSFSFTCDITGQKASQLLRLASGCHIHLLMANTNILCWVFGLALLMSVGLATHHSCNLCCIFSRAPTAS